MLACAAAMHPPTTALFVSLLSVCPAAVSAAPAPTPAKQVGGSIDTRTGARGTAGGFEFPERVVGGNAISLVMPMQWGFLGFLPRVRLGLQYDRQLRRGHWAYVGVAALLDRGNYGAFRTGSCGLENAAGQAPAGRCGSGTVAGVDVYGGYTYKFYLSDHPYLVPVVRGGLGFSWWKYPELGGEPEQARERSWALTGRVGGGVRLFLLGDLAIGVDLDVPMGLLVHHDEPIDVPARNPREFVLGLEILPLLLEYRF